MAFLWGHPVHFFLLKKKCLPIKVPKCEKNLLNTKCKHVVTLRGTQYIRHLLYQDQRFANMRGLYHI